MSRRTRRPETKKLDISQGDWLLVKKHLTAGEQRHIFSRMMRSESNNIEAVKVGVSKIAGYLLDWSFEDADGKPLVIRDQPEDTIVSTLDALDTETFAELVKVIDEHEAAMEQERTQEKNVPDGASNSSTISPSAA